MTASAIPTATPVANGQIPFADMVEHIEKYGQLEHPKGVSVTNRGGAPLPVVADFDKFFAKFGAFGRKLLTDDLNGSSWRVKAQRMRTDLSGNIRLRSDDKAMKLLALQLVFNSRPKSGGVTVIERTVFKAVDNTDHPTEIEAQAWSVAVLREQNVPDEVIAKIVPGFTPAEPVEEEIE